MGCPDYAGGEQEFTVNQHHQRRRSANMATRDEIRAITARGKRAQKKLKKAGKSHVRGLFARLAKEEKVSQAQLRQAVKFAATYSKEELEDFLNLKTPSGRPLGISVAYQIMYVSKRRQRESIARLAAKNGWSIRDVKAEIKRRFGVDEKASKGGRRPRLPANLAEALRQLEEKCDQWQRWVSQLEAEAQGDEANVFSATQLPSNLRKKIQAVTAAMRDLAKEGAKLQ